MSKIKAKLLTESQIVGLKSALNEYEKTHNSLEFSVYAIKCKAQKTKTPLYTVCVNISINCEEYGTFVLTEFHYWELDKEILGILLTSTESLGKLKITF